MTRRLIFLGTASATPRLKRFQSCYAIRWESHLIIMDLGDGAQYRLLKYKVGLGKQTIVLLSHLHMDHTLGLPGFLATRSLQKVTSPLTVVGPPGTAVHMRVMMALYGIPINYPLQVIETTGGQVLENDLFKISAARVIHGRISLGFRVEGRTKPGKLDMDKIKAIGVPEGPLLRQLKNGSSIVFDGKTVEPDLVLGPPIAGTRIVYSGDTRRSEALIELAHKADILIHEATMRVDESHLEEEYDHSSTSTAVEVAKSAEAKRLFLSHISPRNETIHEQLEELDTGDVEVIVAHDGLIVEF